MSVMSRTWKNILRIMVSLLVLLLIAGNSIQSVYAAFDQLIPQRQRGKFFTPSIRMRGQYSDNVSFKRGIGGGRGPAQEKIESMVNFFEPKVSFRLPFDQTFVSLDYKYSLAYFWSRPFDNEDVAHDLNFRFRHDFSQRLSLDVQNDYVNQQAGKIIRSGHAFVGEEIIRRNTIIRNQGDFERNSLDVALKYDIFRYLYLTFKYGNEILDFDSGSASRTFDYVENRVGFETSYILNKDTLLIAGYRFSNREFAKRANADYDSHLLFGGMNYRLGKFFTLDGTGGVDFRKMEAPFRGFTGVTTQDVDFDTIPETPAAVPISDVRSPVKLGTTKIGKNPYVDLRLTSNYFRNMVITLGYRLLTTITEQENFTDADIHVSSVQVSYRIMPKVTLDFSMSYTIDNYEGKRYVAEVNQPARTHIAKRLVNEDPASKYFRLGAVVSYQVTPWLFYELGYKRTDADSDFNNSTWERNDYFTGINAIF